MDRSLNVTSLAVLLLLCLSEFFVPLQVQCIVLRLTVSGGYNDSKKIGSVKRYDPRMKKWSELTTELLSRAFFGACVVDDKIYIAGGR